MGLEKVNGAAMQQARSRKEDKQMAQYARSSDTEGLAVARSTDAEGMAALGICESLLLALTDLTIISEQDARDLLTDVATTHTEAATVSQTPDKHQAVVEIVHRILGAKNGVRH